MDLTGTISNLSTFSVCAVIDLPTAVSGNMGVATFAGSYGANPENATAYLVGQGLGLFDGQIDPNSYQGIAASTPFVGCWVFGGSNSYTAVNDANIVTDTNLSSSAVGTQLTIGSAAAVSNFSGYLGRLPSEHCRHADAHYCYAW